MVPTWLAIHRGFNLALMFFGSLSGSAVLIVDALFPFQVVVGVGEFFLNAAFVFCGSSTVG
jgi:hypothetical protein